jgi:glycosyltransferase involved in cell wall biosynthesis
MTKKILVIGQLPPPVHGSNVMTERLMEALRKNDKPAIIVEKTFSRQLHEVGKRSLGKLFKVPSLYRTIGDVITEEEPEYCIYFITVGLSSLLVDCLMLSKLRKKNVPYILYFHGMGYRKYEGLSIPFLNDFIRKSISSALGGIVLGEGLKKDVNQYISNDKLYVLPNGIPAKTEAPAKRKKSQKDINVIFLSNLIPTKGPKVFIAMADKVRKKEPHVRFMLAGRPASEKYLAELKSYIKDNGLEKNVRIIGPVYGEEKDRFLKEADLMVFPTDKDTFALVNIEAMMWSIPVISSPKGAIPEIIRDGVNGYIVDSNNLTLLVDRVLTLVRDPALRCRMGMEGARLFKENYSLEAYTRNLKSALNYFENMISSA